MKNIKSKFNLRRVDTQVFIFTAFAVTISCFLVFFICYKLTYNDSINSLTERVYSIYNFLEDELDKSTFTTINSKEDMTQESYIEMKELFKLIRETTSVQYLYTAKRNDQGEFVYVIDGLPSNAPDFRCPGDLIEPEIIKDLERALSGETILPDKIIRASWGDIFIVYLPIYENNTVIGTIGIEFFANNQYETYRLIRIAIPIIILIVCAISAFFSVYYFRRVSNPHFQDLANTDYLTGLKNRNAYEVDSHNMCAMERCADAGIIIADLNGLKYVNDNMGHASGDVYIKTFADALKAAKLGNEILYRMGGDEFAVMIANTNTEELTSFIDRANQFFIDSNISEKFPDASASFGYAICECIPCDALEETYRMADANMYNNKNRYYESRRANNLVK